MSILSTNQRLIKVGQDYSAGSGIDITNHVISVTGEVGGNTYSAGDNIGIYEQNNQLYISGKDWTNDIENASANAYEQAIAQIPAPQDLSYISAKVDTNTSGIDYLSGVVITALPSDMATTGDISDLAQSISETYQVKGDYLVRSDSANFYPMTNPSSFVNENWVTAQGYITGVDLSNYYAKNETSSKQEISAAIASIPMGDEEVNELVRSNSGEWNNVSSKLDESTFKETSGLFLTAIPQEYITESELPNLISAKLDISSFSSVSSDFLVASSLNGYATESFVENVSGDITALIPTDYYPNTNPSGFISGVDLSEYYKKTETSSKEEISAAIAAIPLGDEEVNQVVHTNSSTWNTVSGKLDTTSFSDVSGSFLTAVDLSDYATTADLTLKQDTLTFDYDEQNKISAINNSAIAGGVTGEFVPLSSFNELKQSYSALSSLFATYSGQWLLPNEGV